jgi:hypothetical protein
MAAKNGCEAVVKVFLSSKEAGLNAPTRFGKRLDTWPWSVDIRRLWSC